MNWRPKEGWRNPHKETIKTEIRAWIKDAEKRYRGDVESFGKEGSDRGELLSALEASGIEHMAEKVYEAGADAILKELKPLLTKIHVQLCGVRMKEGKTSWYSALDASIDNLKAVLGNAYKKD